MKLTVGSPIPLIWFGYDLADDVVVTALIHDFDGKIFGEKTLTYKGEGTYSGVGPEMPPVQVWAQYRTDKPDKYSTQPDTFIPVAKVEAPEKEIVGEVTFVEESSFDDTIIGEVQDDEETT